MIATRKIGKESAAEKAPHATPAYRPPKFVFGLYVRVTRHLSGNATYRELSDRG
ncbi:MAG: hypothetical protein ACHQLQ_05455 [Candidatus Acidiferrales bacterium]